MISHNNRKINVLFSMIQMKIGGSERLVYNIVKHLNRDLFNPSIAWFLEEAPHKEFLSLNVPLFFLRKSPGIDFDCIKRLGCILTENSIDIVNAHHYMPFVYSFFGAKIMNKVALIYTEHSENDVFVNGQLHWQVCGMVLCRHIDGCVGISSAVADALQCRFKIPRRLVRVIENGVDVDEFKSSKSDKEIRKREFGFLPNDILIGIVANFRHNKNHIFLLRAFLQIARKYVSAKLILVGQGEDYDPECSTQAILRFIREAQLEDSVRIMGYCSNVQDILQILDIFCLVSKSEGLPLSLVEAMACGLPVIGTNIKGIQNIIRHEENGFLVECEDVSGLVGLLERLITQTETRRRMGIKARKYAVERFSFERCMRETEGLFRAAVGNNQ